MFGQDERPGGPLLTFADAVAVLRKRVVAGVVDLGPPGLVQVEEVDLLPAQVDQELLAGGAEGQVGGDQGPVLALAVILLKGQVAWGGGSGRERQRK